MSEQNPENEGPQPVDPTPLDEQEGEHEQVDPDEGDHKPGEPREDFLRNETEERNEKGYVGSLPDEDDRPDLTLKGVTGGTNTEPREDS